MGIVVMILRDNDEGDVDVRVDFEPGLPRLGNGDVDLDRCTEAQLLGSEFVASLEDGLRV
jgi:hypothetical protein